MQEHIKEWEREASPRTVGGTAGDTSERDWSDRCPELGAQSRRAAQTPGGSSSPQGRAPLMVGAAPAEAGGLLRLSGKL